MHLNALKNIGLNKSYKIMIFDTYFIKTYIKVFYILKHDEKISYIKNIY